MFCQLSIKTPRYPIRSSFMLTAYVAKQVLPHLRTKKGIHHAVSIDYICQKMTRYSAFMKTCFKANAIPKMAPSRRLVNQKNLRLLAISPRVFAYRIGNIFLPMTNLPNCASLRPVPDDEKTRPNPRRLTNRVRSATRLSIRTSMRLTPLSTNCPMVKLPRLCLSPKWAPALKYKATNDTHSGYSTTSLHLGRL